MVPQDPYSMPLQLTLWLYYYYYKGILVEIYENMNVKDSLKGQTNWLMEWEEDTAYHLKEIVNLLFLILGILLFSFLFFNCAILISTSPRIQKGGLNHHKGWVTFYNFLYIL